MKISNVEQRSEEWYRLRAGSIGGVRFGQVISGKKNRLLYDLLDETLNGMAAMDDFISDDMTFGIDNEPIARQLYSEQSGIDFQEVGMVHSDQSTIHHASPDGINLKRGIALEIKCSQTGAIHIQRFVEGPESSHTGQIINYFAVSDEIKEVHFVSYCPARPERPIVVKIFKRIEFEKEITVGRAKIKEIENALIDLKNQFIF